jgi:hypothetical protein
MSLDNKNRIFQTLEELFIEKLRLLKYQVNRFPKIWNQLWENNPPDISIIPLIEYNSKNFFNTSEYRIQFLLNFKTLINDVYSMFRYIVETLFNSYFGSALFYKMFPTEIWAQIILKSAYVLIGSLRDLITLNPLDIPIGYIIVGRFTDFLRYNALTLPEIASELENMGYPVDIDTLRETLTQLRDVKFLDAEIKPENNLLAFKYNSSFNLDDSSFSDYPYFQTTLKPLIEWMIGIWRSLFNFRRLHLSLDESYPYFKELEDTLQLAATQGFRSLNAVLVKFVEFFHDFESNLE